MSASFFSHWLLPAALLAASAGVAAQVNRCNTAAGTVYSDKPCGAYGVHGNTLGAPRTGGVVYHPTLPSGPTRAVTGVVSTGSVLRPGCAKTAEDLMHEVVMAFDTHDANRLIGVYHWPGMDTRSGYTVALRLQAMVNKPLLDSAFTGGSEGGTSLREGPNGEWIEVTRRGRPATGISLVLAGPGKSHSRARFGLRRNAGCWWVSL